MKRYINILLLSLLLISVVFAGDETPRKVLKIKLADQPQEVVNKLLKLGLDITSFDRADQSLNVLVNHSEAQQISQLGLQTDTLLSDVDAFARTLRKSGYLERFHTYEQMMDEMNAIVANHPQLAKLEDIGDSYEKTVGLGGYDIWAMKISDNVNIEEDEPEVFFFANTHAREVITPEVILYFMHYLVDNYGSDGYVTHLVNNRQIWLCPTYNPDGHEFVLTGGDVNNTRSDPMWWRKNKRDNNNNGIFDPPTATQNSPDGVDLNRNFGYMWGLDNMGSSPNPGSNVYRGTSPFSEPESQAIRDFVLQHNFIITLSFHSYSQLWLYPWGFTHDHSPDHDIFVALADSCVAYNHYTPETGADLYLVNGDTDDWLYGEQTIKNKIFAFTPEVGGAFEGLGGWAGFFPDTMYIEKQILENQGPMLYMAYAAGEEPIIQHTPLSDTEQQGPYPIIVHIKPPIVLTSPVPLDVANIKLFYNTTGTAPFDSVFLTATGNADEYSGEIPSLGVNGSDIYYYISAADQNGRVAKSPRGAPMATHSFYVGADIEPPVIFHTPLAYGSVFSGAFLIRAQVTDNVGIGSVKLLYRKNTNPLDSLDMVLTSTPHVYEGSIIPVDIVPGDYYEYKILAQDNSVNLNTTQFPDTGFFRIIIKNSILYDFEVGSSFTANNGGDWKWGVPTSGPNSSHSGSNVWATNLSGNYSDMTQSMLETPEISLAGKDSSKLMFWHWYIIEFSDNRFWDGGNVKISVDGGDYEIIEPEGGYDGVVDPYNTFLGNESCFGGPASNGNFWHQETIDLSAYTDHNVKFKFHFASDAAVNMAGWYIDDVEILFKTNTSVKLDELMTHHQPLKFDLKQNYPNPFNPATEIKYSLASEGQVLLQVYNMLGQRVKILVDEIKPAGNYQVLWDGNDDSQKAVASGIYFYKLEAIGKDFHEVSIKKMIKLQ